MPEFHKSGTRPQKRSFLKAFKAWRGMVRATKSGDTKARLDYVFKLLGWLEGDHYYRTWKRIKKTGVDLSLTEKLSKASAMPSGSLGRAYYDHVTDGYPDRFSILSKQGSRDRDEFGLFLDRTIDIHDLIHVVMGYDKGRMGEACVIRASAAAGMPRAWNFLLFLGMLRQIYIHGIREGLWIIRACVLEPQKRAKRVGNWNDIRWEEMLELPLEQVKTQLGISPAPIYDSVIRYANNKDKEWIN